MSSAWNWGRGSAGMGVGQILKKETEPPPRKVDQPKAAAAPIVPPPAAPPAPPPPSAVEVFAGAMAQRARLRNDADSADRLTALETLARLGAVGDFSVKEVERDAHGNIVRVVEAHIR